MAAGDLQPGEPLVTLGGGTGSVVWVHVVPGQAERYDLTVAHDHTYAVGAGLWVIHNTCGEPWPTDKLQPGPFAGDSIPARGPKASFPKFTPVHTCGVRCN